MKNLGYVKLHRKILDNPIVNKDSESFVLWVKLLLLATHKKMKVYFRGREFCLGPGTMLTGRKFLSSFCKISESKVERLLNLYQKSGMIEQIKSNQNRLIKIIKWGEFQEVNEEDKKMAAAWDALKQGLDNVWTTNGQRVDTYNNVIMEE